MFDLPPPDPASVSDPVVYVGSATRVVMFTLSPGQALPETRRTPVILVASTDVTLDLGAVGPAADPVRLLAGQRLYLPHGLKGISNQGEDFAHFTLIDLPPAS